MDGNFSQGMEPIISHVPPAGFVAAPDGIHVENVDKDGEVILDWLCSPIAVIALGRNTENTGWCRWIELVDADGIVHELHIPEKDLSGTCSKVLARLRDRGLRVATGTSARKSLIELLMNWKPTRRYYTTDRLGWVDSTCKNFVLGDKRVLGEDEMVFLNDVAPSSNLAMHRRGTLEDWRTEIAHRCSGNPIMLVAVSLAFAGPLVGFLGRESVGLHLRGGSASGKTTSARAAVSVWSDPAALNGWRTTDNALEGTAATCNGSLLMLDEIAEVSGRVVDKAVYMLGNGQGKDRATSTGGSRSAARWSLTILSTGEISLADKMAEAGKSPMAGQNVRLIDVAADGRRFKAFDELHGAVDGATFAKSVESSSKMCFGVAGPAFVEKLIRASGFREKVVAASDRIAAKWKSTLGVSNDGPAGRVISHFALIGVAGHLATTFGLTGWRSGEALRAAFELAKGWVDAQERSEKWQIDEAVIRTRAYLVAHGDSHFQRAGQPPLSEVAGYRDDNWFYIFADTWSIIHQRHSPLKQAHHLLSGGWLVHGDGKNIQSKTPSWVLGRPRAYRVRADILDEPSNVSVPAARV